MRFKAFKIPVRVDFTFFLMAVVLGYGRRSEPELLAGWVAVVFCSVLLHEMGHALAGKAFGLTPQIQLYAMGGLTWWSDNKQMSPVRDIVISLAGPFAGFVAGGFAFVLLLAFFINDKSGLSYKVVRDVFEVNVFWGMLNLLPILPLDGGSVLRSIERLITKRDEPWFSLIVSVLVATGLAALGWTTGSIWAMLLAGWFGLSNMLTLLQLLRSRHDRSLRSPLERAWQALNSGDGALALKLSREVLESAKSDKYRREATKLFIHGLIQTRNLQMAAREYQELQSRFGPDPYLAALLLLENGQVQESLKLLEAEFESSPSQHVAYLLAHALIRARRYDDALKLAANPLLADRAAELYVELQDESYRAGEYQESARFGAIAFDSRSDPSVAYNVACALARESRPEEALGWLSRAAEAGFHNVGQVTKDADLAPVTRLPEFSSVYKKLLESAEARRAAQADAK
jgi:Zn-dependent protease